MKIMPYKQITHIMVILDFVMNILIKGEVMKEDILIINNQEIKTNEKIPNFDVNLSVGTVKYNIPLELEVIKGSEADLKIQDFLKNQNLYKVKIEITESEI